MSLSDSYHPSSTYILHVSHPFNVVLSILVRSVFIVYFILTLAAIPIFFFLFFHIFLFSLVLKIVFFCLFVCLVSIRLSLIYLQTPPYLSKLFSIPFLSFSGSSFFYLLSLAILTSPSLLDLSFSTIYNKNFVELAMPKSSPVDLRLLLLALTLNFRSLSYPAVSKVLPMYAVSRSPILSLQLTPVCLLLQPLEQELPFLRSPAIFVLSDYFWILILLQLSAACNTWPLPLFFWIFSSLPLGELPLCWLFLLCSISKFRHSLELRTFVSSLSLDEYIYSQGFKYNSCADRP